MFFPCSALVRVFLHYLSILLPASLLESHYFVFFFSTSVFFFDLHHWRHCEFGNLNCRAETKCIKNCMMNYNIWWYWHKKMADETCDRIVTIRQPKLWALRYSKNEHFFDCADRCDPSIFDPLHDSEHTASFINEKKHNIFTITTTFLLHKLWLWKYVWALYRWKNEGYCWFYMSLILFSCCSISFLIGAGRSSPTLKEIFFVENRNKCKEMLKTGYCNINIESWWCNW